MGMVKMRMLAASTLIAALVSIGIGANTVQAAAGIRTPSNVCFWDNLSWSDLRPAEQRAWASLGWNAGVWDKGADPAIANRAWDELSEGQRSVLSSLGYNQAKWDDVECSGHANSDSRDKKREAARSRQAEAPQPAETRQTETKPRMRPMALGLSRVKPKAAPAPLEGGTSSRAYGALVRATIGQYKPRGVGRGWVTVIFSIGPRGALRGVSVARSSGNRQLDQATVTAVRNAAPFPAPPDGAGQTYSLPIYFH
jgi:TonB family protein